MKKFLTVQEASRPEYLGRSPNWIRAGIRLGIIEADMAGNTFIISIEEVHRVQRDVICISRKEYVL